MAAVLSGARVVLVAVPACGHADVARACAAHLRHGQTVLLLPGRTGGAWSFAVCFTRPVVAPRIVLGEANTFPFAARCVGPASAVIYGTKAEVLAAALPANRTPQLLAACRPFLPMLRPARSILHTGFANLGAILHPVITLLNADRIAAGDSFDFYCQGVTSTVAADTGCRRRGTPAHRPSLRRAGLLAPRLDRPSLRSPRRHHPGSGRRQPGLCRHQGAHDARCIAICWKTCRPA